MPDQFVDTLADAIADRLTKIHGRRKRLYDLDEAAVYLGLSEDAVRDLVSQGKLKAVRPTRKLQFDVLELDRLVDSL